MKKTITVLISLILIISLFLGCAKRNDATKDSGRTKIDNSVENNFKKNTEDVKENNEIDTESKVKQTGDCVSKEDNADKSGNNYDVVTNKKLSIVTTIFPQYDFTKQIVGDKAEVIMLLKPGSESHTYEPTPQDIKAIQSSDLFIYTGGENDNWIEGIIESMGDNAPATMKLVDLVNTVEEEIVEGMQHEHADNVEQDHAEEHEHQEKHDHEHMHEVDEHVWTSPINAITIVEQITDVLSEKDPINVNFYSNNSAMYIEQLKNLDQQFEDVVDHAKRKIVLFGDRFPFRYFADEYGLDYYAAFTGCSENTEASAATVAFLIDKVNALQLPVVFSIELSNEKIADSIAEATDAEKMTFHSIHNLSVEEFAANETYISLMEKNIEVLEKALN